jgi:hypothetical protein
MPLVWDSPEPMTAAELRAVLRLMDQRKLKEQGETVTPLRLKELLGCAHVGAHACQACLPDPERKADGKVTA